MSDNIDLSSRTSSRNETQTNESKFSSELCILFGIHFHSSSIIKPLPANLHLSSPTLPSSNQQTRGHLNTSDSPSYVKQLLMMDTTSTTPNHDGENVMPTNQPSGVGETSPDQIKSEPTNPPPPQQASQTPTLFGGAGAFIRGHRRSRVVLRSREDLANIDFGQVFEPMTSRLPSSSTVPEEPEEKEKEEKRKKKKGKKVRFDFDELEAEGVFAEWLSELQDV
ncbi:hypothetical protein TWF506_005428 [Arthrobotrys conoides]|uniref:Uncharacterized protein n=1 Tax=Arthrobotrys conoides TaxID=74498 RepID=A0AAN8NTJ5_9PEZI